MKHVHILLVEDSMYSADLNVRELKRAGLLVEHQVVASKAALQRALEARPWDVILSDNNMPGFDALQALGVRNNLGCSTPFVIVSEDISDKDISKAFEQGCCSFIKKEHLEGLGSHVKKIIEQFETHSLV